MQMELNMFEFLFLSLPLPLMQKIACYRYYSGPCAFSTYIPEIFLYLYIRRFLFFTFATYSKVRRVHNLFNQFLNNGM